MPLVPMLKRPWHDGTGGCLTLCSLSHQCLDAAMPPRIDDVMRMCCDLPAHQKIKVSVHGSARGAVVAVVGALLGGLIMGPPGVAAGGAVGGFLGCWLVRAQFKPLPQILMGLPPAQQQKLYSDIMVILDSLDWTDAAQLVALVRADPTLQRLVSTTLLSYVMKELRAEVSFGD
ncbi:protein C19orf12 homolog [Genypterus blacodes]|uniref:protein C19orf12 homolog n=1 Tax=Genypterus blacodes TaxID=154954 RepID=UPI003F758BBF